MIFKSLKQTSLQNRRWDIIRKGWKWIAVSTDADNPRAIHKSINELIDKNKAQTKINKDKNDYSQQSIENLKED